MKIKKRIIVLAVIAGLITAFLTIAYINSNNNNIPSALKTVSVVVAVEDIPANVKITNNMVQVKELPVISVHVNAISDLNEVIGQISSNKIVSGEQVIKDRLALGQSDTSISFTIPANMRAIAIPINEETGVAGYISIGDRIDIYIQGESAPIQYNSIVVLQKGINAPGDSEVQATNKGLTTSLTLLVNPDQASVLANAIATNNPIVVILRNPSDI